MPASSHLDSLQVVLWNSSSAEDSSVSEVLGGKISNRELGEHNLGSRVEDGIKLVVNDGPFSVNELLVVFNILDSDLSILLLGLELKLKVEKANDRVIKALGLLLESSV